MLWRILFQVCWAARLQASDLPNIRHHTLSLSHAHIAYPFFWPVFEQRWSMTSCSCLSSIQIWRKSNPILLQWHSSQVRLKAAISMLCLARSVARSAHQLWPHGPMLKGTILAFFSWFQRLIYGAVRRGRVIWSRQFLGHLFLLLLHVKDVSSAF